MLICGNALSLPLRDRCVQTCITSPPYGLGLVGRVDVRGISHIRLKAFRAQSFTPGMRCPITGDVLHNDLSTHVDHDPPFESILKAFLNGVPLDSIETDATQDNDLETHLTDRALAEQWRAYHQQHAGLRLVSKRANLSHLRKRT